MKEKNTISDAQSNQTLWEIQEQIDEEQKDYQYFKNLDQERLHVQLETMSREYKKNNT